MDEQIIPYELPEQKNHSFFFIDQRIQPNIEAKLHGHDAWELYCVVQGYGNRTAGDTVQPFTAGDVALIPPKMHHRWEYNPSSVGKDGRVRYLMAAFSHQFVERSIREFPEVRNSLAAVVFPTDALKFGHESARVIRKMLQEMADGDELTRLCLMLRLLPVIFTSGDRIFAGSPIRIERDVRRLQQVSEYVMAHYIHPITLDEIAAEVGMNRSSFCIWFKRKRGMTFTQFVIQYRLNTAATMLRESNRQVSEICYAVGFNDLPHFVRAFTKAYGFSPTAYRKHGIMDV